VDDGDVNDCTAVHDESCGVQPLFHVIEHLAGDVMLFQQVSKVQECRSIRCPFDGEVDLQEALHGIAVIDCILDSLVRETEPVLHEIHAQHRFERDSLPATLFLDVERRNEFHPFFPRDDGFHGI
jgi:hypothetical protein